MRNELTASGTGQPLTPEEQLSFQAWMWRLLAGQTSRYTMNQSSSVTQETAEELLESLLFTLKIDQKAPEYIRTLLPKDPKTAYEQGLRSLKRKVAEGRTLWEQCCMCLPEPENQSLHDTLRSIGGFWKQYDLYYFAHRIPADINYPLSRPVPETLQGVDYVNTYLRRLLAENRFIRRFAPDRVLRLLYSYCLDFRELPINLFEPVAANAVGLVLAGQDPLLLDVTDADRATAGEWLDFRSETALPDAARRLCTVLEIRDPEEQRCLARMAESLGPRIRAARDGGNLSGVFLPLDAGEDWTFRQFH